MISSITISGVASFSAQEAQTFDTNKKVNFIYGHNGTGKSTIGRYFQTPSDNKFNSCNLNLPNAQDYTVLVYNEEFATMQFLSSEKLKGIFTLGQKNVEAEHAIIAANTEIENLETSQTSVNTEITIIEQSLNDEKSSIKDQVFSEKAIYDRGALDFCLTGVKNSKDNFYNKVNSTVVEDGFSEDIKQLVQEAQELNDSNVVPKNLLPNIELNFSTIENTSIFNEVIVSSGESYLAEVVSDLKNSEWINSGRKYLSELDRQCPFCQQELQDGFIDAVNALFDKSYEHKKENLQYLNESYSNLISQFELLFENEIFNDDYVKDNSDLTACKLKMLSTLKENLKLIEQKILDPSQKVFLSDSSTKQGELNKHIEIANQEIRSFNNRVGNPTASLNVIKEKFWKVIRQKYDSAITTHELKCNSIKDNHSVKTGELQIIRAGIKTQREIISENRKKITNVDRSIENINKQSKLIGLEGFEIKKVSDEENHYYLHRNHETNSAAVFKTLSEGEKNLITFLYFLELCQGSLASDSSTGNNKKIIVIDDPISSLSHNYIYEVASLLHQRLLKGAPYAQVFMLTHSLYFLHEMLKYAPNRREDFERRYNLLRITKNQYSTVQAMERNEIQNDYQSYWQVVKDAQNGSINKVVLPNMMRNILEYYFGFVHKSDALAAELTALEAEDAEFKPFFRFINRQSHSDSININDMGEINPQRFVEKFRAIFERMCFLEHYEKMMS